MVVPKEPSMTVWKEMHHSLKGLGENQARKAREIIKGGKEWGGSGMLEEATNKSAACIKHGGE